VLAGGEGFGERQAEGFKRADVDEVADFRTPEQGTQLVREDLLRRVGSRPGGG
jgi:hypothetical protein